MNYTLHHSILYTGDQILYDYSLVIEKGRIHSFFPSSKARKEQGDLNLEGMVIAPGFMDLQVYGAMGKLFNNTQDLETLKAIHEYTIKTGTTRYLVTLSTSSLESTFKAIEIVKIGLKDHYPGLLGLHLEGPFINALKRGAHLENFIQKPNLPLLKEIMEKGKGVIKMMTIAPELFDAESLNFLSQSGILISAGHSNASYEEAMAGFSHGIHSVTHLYNAMSPLGSREPGLVGATLDHHSVMAAIIPDGIHCSFPSLRIAKKIMGSRLFIITDAVTETLEGPYKFKRGHDQYINDQGTLSGSALSMIKGVENCVKKAGLSLVEALRMSSTYPAKILGDPQLKGTIRPGNLADLVVFDSQYKIHHVFYEGEKLRFASSPQ